MIDIYAYTCGHGSDVHRASIYIILPKSHIYLLLGSYTARLCVSYSYNLIVRQAAVVKRPYSAYEFLNGVFAEGYSEMELEQYLNNN